MFTVPAVANKICRLFFLSSFLFLMVCSAQAQNAHKIEKIDKIKRANVLRVCSSSGFIPFDMKNSKGEWLGFDYSMMKAFTEYLEVKHLNMVDINYDGIIPALIAGKCDMIASGMTVTEERKKVLSFSKPVYVSGLSAAMKLNDENKKHYKTIADLDKKNIKIAVKTGYTSDIFVTKNLKNVHIMRFDHDPDLVNAVLQGKANALVTDSPYIRLAAGEYKNKIYILKDEVGGEEIAVAANKPDVTLTETFDKFFAEWKKNGGYEKAFSSAFITQDWRKQLSTKSN